MKYLKTFENASSKYDETDVESIKDIIEGTLILELGGVIVNHLSENGTLEYYVDLYDNETILGLMFYIPNDISSLEEFKPTLIEFERMLGEQGYKITKDMYNGTNISLSRDLIGSIVTYGHEESYYQAAIR